MLYNNITEKILGLQEVIIKKCDETESICRIEIELQRKQCICPCCGRMTDRIHDYRKQVIKDLPCFGRKTVILLRKRRYVCECGKRFAEPNTFLPKYQRRTQRATVSMINRLSEAHSFTSVAKEFGVSVNCVINTFNIIKYPKPDKLPEVIGIDEFKGNSGKEKYHCIITDIKNKKVIDILHTRYEHELLDYFKRFDRSNVKYFVSDMYSTYSEIAKYYFPKATYVIDKYHWIRQTLWAFEAIRKEIQKKFSKEHRIYFKHSKNLLLKRQKSLKKDQWLQVSNMLYLSPTLSTAYFLKEQLYELLELKDSVEQKRRLKEWIEEASESDIQSFEKVAETYRRWFIPITNSLDCPYTNGFTEGCNNKIKVLKRIAYGYRNFKRFRNRILFTFSSRGGA